MWQNKQENSPKKSINIKKLRRKIGIYVPVIRCDITMATFIIKKINTQKITLIISLAILVKLYKETFERN